MASVVCSLFNVDAGSGARKRPVQHIPGSFRKVALAGDLIITLDIVGSWPNEVNFGVQLWPCRGPASCLWQFRSVDSISIMVSHLGDLALQFSTSPPADWVGTSEGGQVALGQVHNQDVDVLWPTAPMDEPVSDTDLPASASQHGEDVHEQSQLEETTSADLGIVSHEHVGSEAPMIEQRNVGVAASSEQPARIDPEEAAQIEQQLWTSSIERLRDVEVLSEQSWDDVRICVIHFNRHPEVLVSALMSSRPAQLARNQGVDIEPAWVNHAKVFVAGLGPQHFSACPGGMQLAASHLVIHAEHEAEIDAALQHLPYRVKKHRAREVKHIARRNAAVWAFPGDLSLFEVSDEGEEDIQNDAGIVIEYQVVRGFIHVGASPHASRSSVSI